MSSKLGAWTLPTKEELRPVLANRHMMYVGDSLSGQEFKGAIFLLSCGMGLQAVPVPGAFLKRNWTFPEFNLIVSHVRADFLVAGSTSASHDPRASWYIDEKGVKHMIRDQGKTQFVMMDYLNVIPEMQELARHPRAVFVVNFGHWVKGHRGDVYFMLKDKRLQFSEDLRMMIYKNITVHVAAWAQQLLGPESYAFWHGYSAFSNSEKLCGPGQVHPWTDLQQQGVRQGVNSVQGQAAGSRSVFLSLDCVTSNKDGSSKDAVFADSTHFKMPGPPDVQSMMVWRALGEAMR